MTSSSKTLVESLAYQPQELRFGTSGRRGELVHLTQLEIYINALAELRYLQGLPASEGGIVLGEDFYFAYDLRPSSTQFSAEAAGRGELCQAIANAVEDAGMHPINLGAVPTPALTYFALSKGKGSIMVTGSHIPFDRNGYKLNTSRGELLKVHEEPIGRMVAEVRREVYKAEAETSPFDKMGMLKDGHRDLPAAHFEGMELYRNRYTSFFQHSGPGRLPLQSKRFLVYQHSAVGRDLLVEILRELGAEVIPAGRSESFVPIDTEDIDDQQLAVLQDLADSAAERFGALDGVVSTDGDSDRPLLLGVDGDGRLRFFGGDLVGMIVAEYLCADAVVVPISCNDAIDRGSLKPVLRPKTKIGSPFVIDAMEAALQDGAKTVCGWEANGGFLLGSHVSLGGHVLKKLATRDAMLPILGVLSAAVRADLSLIALFERLPKRFSRAALLKQFPRATSLAILKKFGPGVATVKEDLGEFFPESLRFAPVASLDYTDGVRITFANGEVAHVRPSGNADELRIYAVADTQARADEITREGIADPDGILRKMERSIR